MIFDWHQTIANYQRTKNRSLTACLPIISIIVVLIAACATVPAQNQTSAPDTISITVSNRSDRNMTLTLLPVQRPQPPRIRIGTASTPQSLPPLEVKTNAVQTVQVEQTVRSNHFAVVELHPGLYRLGMNPPVPEFGGFLSVTNSETWIFSTETTKQSAGDGSKNWKLEVPSRPGLQLIKPVTPPPSAQQADASLTPGQSPTTAASAER